MSDLITARQAKGQILQSLQTFLKKNEESINKLMAREAQGRAKLAKSLKKDEGDFIPNLNKDAMSIAPAPQAVLQAAPQAASQAAPSMGPCLECGGGNLEPLGIHLGASHYICRDCSYDGTTIQQENQQQEQNQAADAAATQAAMGKAEMDSKRAAKVRQDIRQQKVISDHIGGAFNPQVASESAGELRGESDPDSFAPGATEKFAKLNHRRAYKAELPMGKAEILQKKPQSVENIRMSAGIASVGVPKAPSVKKASIPQTGATKPIKDAFNTGGSNNGVLKAEPSPETPPKKPFNQGNANTGKPFREVAAQETGAEAAREGAVPPPEEGGKEVSATGSGGEVKKDKALEKGDFATMDAKAKATAAPKSTALVPSPKATSKAKVSDIRARAAAKHGATRAQRANDIKVFSALKAMKDAGKLGQATTEAGPQAAPKAIPLKPVSGGFKQVDQKAASMGKAEGIPSAPKAPGSDIKPAPVKASNVTPMGTPNKSVPKL